MRRYDRFVEPAVPPAPRPRRQSPGHVGQWAAELARQAAAEPDGVAVAVDGGADLTFGSWDRRSRAVAAGLAARGVQPGARVALRFDAEHWAEFAVAYTGVLRAGVVAVLVPAGLSDADAGRIVRHAGVAGLLAPPHLAAPAGSVWSAAVADVLLDGAPAGGEVPAADPAATAEVVYPRQPMAPPRPLSRTWADLTTGRGLDGPGWLVHTWAPGSLAGQWALAAALAGRGTRIATLGRFTADGLTQLLTRLQATACGLTPGLAAALAAAVAPPLPFVATVILSPCGSPPPDLAGTFPHATVVGLPLDASTTPGPEAAAVGPSQVGMLWHEQLAPGSFNLPSLVRRYRGPVDAAALGRALDELARRHEPLRTTFSLQGGAPAQIVGPPPELAVTDLGARPAGERELEAARLIGDATSRPFDLVDGPLFAPHLLRFGDDDHVLIVRLHHTAFDDWSVDVFRRELSTLYAACLPAATATAPEPPLRFVDVCRQQRARLAGDPGDAERAYWRAQMAGAPLAARLVLGQPHQLGPDRPGAGEPFRRYLPTILVRDLRALAPRLRATTFMTVLAAFEVVLARRAAVDDLVFATVVAGRRSTATERMIGCFTKKVLLRVKLDGDPTFAELVARTRATVLGALAHQDLPFEAVVQDTIGRSAAEHGLPARVPVVFQGETPQRFRLAMPGVEVAPFEMASSTRRERHSSARDGAPPERAPAWGDGALTETFLVLSLLELEDGLALVARGVFHRPAVRGLLEELEAVLTEIVRSPDRRLSELGLRRPAPPGTDELELLGLRLDRARIEKALASCPGVADAGVAVTGSPDGGRRLVAYVVADERHPRPSLAQLRTSLWAAHPGSPWPAAVAFVDALPRRPDGCPDVAALPLPPIGPDGSPDPQAVLLSAIWAEAGGHGATPDTSYWQDFTFLRALADARAAGIPITDGQVSRCRTPAMLAAALGATRRGRPDRRGEHRLAVEP